MNYTYKPPRIIIDKNLCQKCHNCVHSCTAFDGVYEIGDDGYPRVVRPEQCVQCLICHTVCPVNAIRHEDYRETLLLDLSGLPLSQYEKMI